MKVLLTGANGYIGKRLLPALIHQGHFVVCCVRDHNRFTVEEEYVGKVEVVEVDFLQEDTLANIPHDIEGAYFLIHSMSSKNRDFESLETMTAQNFKVAMNRCKVKHVIYLGGIINDEQLSRHLQSRKKVEDILAKGDYQFTGLHAGIILGSGSASFEIIRDLVEKLPFMIAPKWLLTRSQPIAIRNVIEFLSRSLSNPYAFGKSFDIAGPDIMTYKQMLLRFAKIRGLRRWIVTVPLMTPKLSSYWLYFVTSTSYKLASNLVESMKVPIIGQKNDLARQLDIQLLDFETAIKLAFLKIQQNDVLSSWTDSLTSGILDTSLSNFVQVPTFGCFTDVKKRKITDAEKVMARIWSIGGNTGWYYGTWLWKIRGFMDKLSGGVGLRRGRTNLLTIHPGDALDFWRVLLADREKQRLLLFAEMKLPGEAWLEFQIDSHNCLCQKATFRPRGLLGRIYWYTVLPFHYFIFNGMINNIISEYRSDDKC
ncbi:MAG: SDR family oxidoreductase [Cyclobacteriaceae bacterium]|nr:SDR family oxidoreductase [Cyclobacteriaceae bacterium]